ncbi:MAG: sugar transferase [Marinilabiliaceae bacterium]|nr:sugar transferase [Marinilabiliaceae bacterium]
MPLNRKNHGLLCRPIINTNLCSDERRTANEMKDRKLSLSYIFFDVLGAQLAWALFFFFRKLAIEQKIFGPEFSIKADNRLILGLIIIPVFWITVNFLAGFYNKPLRKSRLSDLGMTFFITLGGTVILFFALILDDVIVKYTNYYLSFGVLFFLQFFFTYIPRFIITSHTVHSVHKGKIGFNTLIVGANGRALDIYRKISSQARSSGNNFVGFISKPGQDNSELEKYIENLGSFNDLADILESRNVEEVILAIEHAEREELGKLISYLRNTSVIIKAVPVLYDLLLGRIKMSTIFGTPLIHINSYSMPSWQYNIKRILDYFIAFFSLILLSPLILALAIAIKCGSRGPVLFKQARVGKNGKEFMIYKFRSMLTDAEDKGPALSSKDDDRVTAAGKYMRKHRLDEIPNFINVLKGEMSIVGPRPERKYYIDRIVEKAPHYRHLLRVIPGITSWGQVKFGYASNVDEMIDRLEYDLIYLDNMSLYVDFKIIIYTLLTIIRGRGF